VTEPAARVTRLYVFAVTLLVFFVTWAVVAARPWASRSARTAQDPRVAALTAKENRIHLESRLVRRLQARQALQVAATAPPPPRIVTLPPLTITRTS
jgi:hypothetical protein